MFGYFTRLLAPVSVVTHSLWNGWDSDLATGELGVGYNRGLSFISKGGWGQNFMEYIVHKHDPAPLYWN